MAILEKANCRRILTELPRDPLVKKVKMHHNRLVVYFTTGLRERWLRPEAEGRNRTPRLTMTPFDGKPLRIGYQFEFNELDPNRESLEHFFEIRYKAWKEASFIDQRLSIHRLVARILKMGWKDVCYPNAALLKDLKRLTSVDIERRHTHKGILYLHGFYGSRIQPGKILAEQFLFWTRGESPTKDGWKNARALRKAIDMILRNKRNVTRHSVITKLQFLKNNYSPDNYGDIYFSPNIYRLIFRRFGLQNMTIADPEPGIGVKAVAAMLEDLHYHADVDLSDAAKFFGTDFGKLDQDVYDAVILDSNLGRDYTNLVKMLEIWDKKATFKIAVVPRHLHGILRTPERFLPIQMSPKNPDDRHYVYLYT